MSGNFAIKGGGGGVRRLMANAILNFHFDYPHPSLSSNYCRTATFSSKLCIMDVTEWAEVKVLLFYYLLNCC